MIEYSEDASVKQAIARFDNQAIDGQICRVTPYLKKGEKPASDDARRSQSMLARRIYLMNLSYKATNAEVEKLVAEFVPVD